MQYSVMANVVNNFEQRCYCSLYLFTLFISLDINIQLWSFLLFLVIHVYFPLFSFYRYTTIC